ncbi:MAG TPA: tetratricopeptide repeat protein [Pseudolabrys sp.]|jgi:tetratricopeptide (TPR) repeat protein
MIRFTSFATALLISVAIWAEPATAQDYKICELESGDVAIAACDRAIASGTLSSSNLAWAYHNRAVEYEVKKQFELATADYTRALGIDPNRAGSLVGRGNCYSSTGQYDRATNDYNDALRIDPKSPNALQNRGFNFEKMKNYAKARADYKKALEFPARGNSDRVSQERARAKLAELPAE